MVCWEDVHHCHICWNSTVTAGLQHTGQYLGDLQYTLFAWIHKDRNHTSIIRQLYTDALLYSTACNCSSWVKWSKHVLNLSENNTVLLQHFGLKVYFVEAFKVSIVLFTAVEHAAQYHFTWPHYESTSFPRPWNTRIIIHCHKVQTKKYFFFQQVKL